MALDDLSGDFVTFARDEVVSKYKRDYLLRAPDAETGDGTQPDIDARTLADLLTPLYSDAVVIANGINEDEAKGQQLDRVGARYGVTRGAKTGARGFVEVQTSTVGGTIRAGDVIKNPQTKLRYQAAETKFCTNLAHIQVTGIDKGPGTDIAAGVIMQWEAPRPGVSPNATVLSDGSGGGLSGGADDETDPHYLGRIQDARRNPPASGNDAEVQSLIAQTPDVPVEQPFTYPAVFGGVSTAFAFTTLPSKPGASRIPSAAQVGAVGGFIGGQLPADFSIFSLLILADPKEVVFNVLWDVGGSAWADSQPWPDYYARGAGALVFDTGATATSFSLKTDTGSYAGVRAPIAGNVLAAWDPGAKKFRKKTIKTVTGTGPYAIDCDTSGSATDTTFAPASGQRVMPWADGLSQLEAPVLKYFDGLGPGEMFATFLGDNRRQRRMPRSPRLWPASISSDLLVPVLALDAVLNATLVEGNGAAPALGTPGVFVNMITLSGVAVFPLAS